MAKRLIVANLYSGNPVAISGVTLPTTTALDLINISPNNLIINSQDYIYLMVLNGSTTTGTFTGTLTFTNDSPFSTTTITISPTTGNTLTLGGIYYIGQLSSSLPPDAVYSYTLTITYTPTNGTATTYTVDPKMQMNP